MHSDLGHRTPPPSGFALRPSAPAVNPRQQRMFTVLLAACDPHGVVAAGAAPTVYVDTAAHVLALVETEGPDEVAIINALDHDADASAALQFARAATDWWKRDRDTVWGRL